MGTQSINRPITRRTNCCVLPLFQWFIVFTLVARYAVTLVVDILYHTLHFNYLDYLMRYKMQNAVTMHFVEKMATLDIAHFENPATQNLITQVRSTMKWQIPDLLRYIGAVLRDFISYMAALLVLIPFAWWIPLIITVVTIPRLYLRSKYGTLQWSLWGAGAPQMRKLYYYDNLFADPVAVREMRIAQSAPQLLQKFDSLQGLFVEPQ